MLAECVVAEQYVVLRKVAGHAVGPVEHRHLNEDKLFTVSDIDLVSRFDYMEIPVLMILPL
ncbi:hypothetical protein SDC9_155285 [bioreactor metagenome]|uniref:Uncharacterized protein n=1 Tax=bioreactor metagenome TaxID=1076179 RepID=A0A645F3K6_9ZZZZ